MAMAVAKEEPRMVEIVDRSIVDQALEELRALLGEDTEAYRRAYHLVLSGLPLYWARKWCRGLIEKLFGGATEREFRNCVKNGIVYYTYGVVTGTMREAEELRI